MSDHKHGEMNTEVQEATYNGFIKVSSWVAGISIGILILAALING